MSGYPGGGYPSQGGGYPGSAPPAQGGYPGMCLCNPINLELYSDCSKNKEGEALKKLDCL